MPDDIQAHGGAGAEAAAAAAADASAEASNSSAMASNALVAAEACLMVITNLDKSYFNTVVANN